MKAMISQPMAGLTKEEILKVREKAEAYLEAHEYEVVNTFFDEEWKEELEHNKDVVNVPLKYLAKSLDTMATCDLVYFCYGWENARGCRIEYEAALAYDLDIIMVKREGVE